MTFNDFKRQIPPTLTLALPLAFSQLGQMLMGIVDTFMVGKLGPEYIAAVGLGNSFFWMCGLPSIGILMGLDFLVSYSFGKNDLDKCHSWLIQGMFLALAMSIPLAGLIYFASFHLESLGIAASLANDTKYFLSSYCWSLIPFSLFIPLRQYIQSMGRVRAVTVIMFAANGLNAFLNWVFIYGNGVNPMGVAGSGVATFVTRSAMTSALLIYILYVDKKKNQGLRQRRVRLDWPSIVEIFKLGIPAAGQVGLEVGVFSLSTALAGHVGVVPLAAHTIVLNIASFTFMVPLGVSAAAAILVGQALGKGDKKNARIAGWSSFALGVGFMGCSALFLFLFGREILFIFTTDPAVIELGRKVLILAAIFQVFDGTQTVGTGALRGVGETRFPMFANLFGHWFLGLPIGIFLCFYYGNGHGSGLVGLWIGLTVGLIAVATAILFSWTKNATFADAELHDSN